MNRTNNCANPLVDVYIRGNYKLQAIFDASVSAGFQQAAQQLRLLHDALRDILLSSVDDIPKTIVHCLQAASIRTIGDLVSTTRSELLQVRGIGPQSVTVLETVLRSLQFSLSG